MIGKLNVNYHIRQGDHFKVYPHGEETLVFGIGIDKITSDVTFYAPPAVMVELLSRNPPTDELVPVTRCVGDREWDVGMPRMHCEAALECPGWVNEGVMATKRCRRGTMLGRGDVFGVGQPQVGQEQSATDQFVSGGVTVRSLTSRVRNSSCQGQSRGSRR